MITPFMLDVSVTVFKRVSDGHWRSVPKLDRLFSTYCMRGRLESHPQYMGVRKRYTLLENLIFSLDYPILPGYVVTVEGEETLNILAVDTFDDHYEVLCERVDGD